MTKICYMIQNNKVNSFEKKLLGNYSGRDNYWFISKWLQHTIIQILGLLKIVTISTRLVWESNSKEFKRTRWLEANDHQWTFTWYILLVRMGLEKRNTSATVKHPSNRMITTRMKKRFLTNYTEADYYIDVTYNKLCRIQRCLYKPDPHVYQICTKGSHIGPPYPYVILDCTNSAFRIIKKTKSS